MTNEQATPLEPQASNVTGPRIVAGLIDLVLLAVVGFVFTTTLGESDSSDSGVNFSLNGTPFLLYVAVCFAYGIILEGLTGQTLGKKIMGLRVVAVDGPLSWGSVIIRNILRTVDGFPYVLPYVVGLICVAVNRNHQRIGDIAAKTLVVRA